MTRPDEEQEWVGSRVDAWVETYKKSMLTPVVLRAVEDRQPATVVEIAELVASRTGWSITERSLYRTLKRLQDSGLLRSSDVDVPRTGAKLKELSLTGLGARFLAGVSANLVDISPPLPNPDRD